MLNALADLFVRWVLGPLVNLYTGAPFEGSGATEEALEEDPPKG